MFTSTNAILSSCSANCIFKRVSCRRRFETAASGRSSRMRTSLQQPTGLRTAGQVTPARARARVCCHCTGQHRSLPQTCDGWFGGWKEAVSSSAPAVLKPPATFPVLAEGYANANDRVEAVLGRLQKSFHQPVSLRGGRLGNPVQLFGERIRFSSVNVLCVMLETSAGNCGQTGDCDVLFPRYRV